MCLSNVYVKKKEDESPIVEEAAKIIYDKGTVVVHTLFGEKKVFQGKVLDVKIL